MADVNKEVKQQLASNEAIFREINEGIERGQWPGEEDSPTRYRCECAQLGCSELVELTSREYERVRESGRRFIVVPGHERPEIEQVVKSGEGYLVVEKVGQAAETADSKDPRGS